MPEKTHRIKSDGQTEGPPTRNTPSFVLGDFDDLVAFYTKCDSFEHGDSIVPEKESQKKCRFCT